MKQLVQRITKFNKDRSWDKVKPGNIAKSIIIESAELLEHFQWEDKPIEIDEASSEAADIFIYLVGFCNALNIDLEKSVLDKLEHNAKKYPIGSNYYQQKQLYRS